ncbi:MAG: PEP-CTERM sorting domain-containing protein [Planctomycetales bacterium]
MDSQLALLLNSKVHLKFQLSSAIGPQLSNGDYSLQLLTDNDFSVTQNASNTQFGVFTNLTNSTQTVPLDAPEPADLDLIPTYLYSLRADLDDYVRPVSVPEPSTWVFLLAVGAAALRARRRHS